MFKVGGLNVSLSLPRLGSWACDHGHCLLTVPTFRGYGSSWQYNKIPGIQQNHIPNAWAFPLRAYEAEHRGWLRLKSQRVEHCLGASHRCSMGFQSIALRPSASIGLSQILSEGKGWPHGSFQSPGEEEGIYFASSSPRVMKGFSPRPLWLSMHRGHSIQC